jgi:hypothetical protein
VNLQVELGTALTGSTLRGRHARSVEEAASATVALNEWVLYGTPNLQSVHYDS